MFHYLDELAEDNQGGPLYSAPALFPGFNSFAGNFKPAGECFGILLEISADPLDPVWCKFN